MSEGPANRGGIEETKTASSPSRWATREAFFFNHGANIAVWTFYLALNVGVMVWGIWEFTVPHWSTPSDVLRITLPIARAGGRLVTLNAAIILITACKFVWSMIRRYTVIPLGFPVDNIMPEYHRFVAWNMIQGGCIVHSIPQIYNYASQSIPILSDMPVWTLGDGFSTKQLLYTGSLLFVIFTMFFITTLQRVRHTSFGFRLFWIAHCFGIITAFPLLIIHGTVRGYPIVLYFVLVPLGVYIGDVIIRRFVLVTRPATIVEWSSHEDQGERVTKLVLDCEDFDYTPGQYAELKIPQISYYEWHPFTIASAPMKGRSTRVIFYIKAAGKWTNRLYNIVSSSPNEKNNVEIYVRGPHGAPAMNYLAYKHLMVIGSGIGVTPLLSIWQQLVYNGSKLICEPIQQESAAKGMGNKIRKESDYKQVMETEQELLDRVSAGKNIGSVDVVALESTKMTTFRGKCAYWASILETMTVNICYMCLAVTTETVVFCVWLYPFDREAAILQIAISFLGLLLFGGKILLSLIAYGFTRYGRSMVCFLEVSIVLLDVGALGSSFFSVKEPNRKSAIAYFLFFTFFILLHGVRIFHIFHATARPPIVDKRDNMETITVEKVHSIHGVWVSRYFSSMSFAAMDLVNTLPSLSPVFHLTFYGTREKPEAGKQRFDATVQVGNHAVYPSRPDWESLFQEAIQRAHSSNPEGEAVGVFFCGSPAIARDLQRTAQLVTAQHQHYSNAQCGAPCSCRILVHKENF